MNFAAWQYNTVCKISGKLVQNWLRNPWNSFTLVHVNLTTNFNVSLVLAQRLQDYYDVLKNGALCGWSMCSRLDSTRPAAGELLRHRPPRQSPRRHAHPALIWELADRSDVEDLVESRRRHDYHGNRSIHGIVVLRWEVWESRPGQVRLRELWVLSRPGHSGVRRRDAESRLYL